VCGLSVIVCAERKEREESKMLITYKGKRDKFVSCYDPQKNRLTIVPAGWHEPHYFSCLGEFKQRIHPAKKRPAMIHLPGCTTYLNYTRVVSAEVEQQINEIDRQVIELRKQRQQLLEDNFLTFELVTVNDLPITSFEKVYASKKEAELAFKGKGVA
jgi:hypothetical protein